MVETYSPTPARFDARANLWWLIAAIGIGLLALAYVILFFNGFDDNYRDGEQAPAVFKMLGVLALAAGLALGSLFMTGASAALRLAMLLGAAVFLLGLGGVMPGL